VKEVLLMNFLTFHYEDLKRFCEDTFNRSGFSPEESQIIADVILQADLSGIPSHGIRKLYSYYNKVKRGEINQKASFRVVFETDVSSVIDADRAMGQIAGKYAMRLAIDRAKSNGIAMVAVRNSSHYGIAGYYAEMAVKDDLIGISMTNTGALGVPVYGRDALFGTNPISLAFPTAPYPFLFDAATTVIPLGKLEIYDNAEKPLPESWAVDNKGRVSCDTKEILKNIIGKSGGGILPLGGNTETFGGHKGYGLALIVELFTGIFAGGRTSNHVNTGKGETSHFFMAIDYGIFGEKTVIKEHFSRFLQEVRDSPKAEGEPRIFIHGEKEFENRIDKLARGIPVDFRTNQELKEIAASCGLNYNAYFSY
jgi:LDH2 family malate/lactate/ureidoglycolate dehydrogenase